MNAPGETSDIHDATPAPVGDALPSRPASELDIELLLKSLNLKFLVLLHE